MSIIRSASVEVRHSFYVDPEVYVLSDSFDHLSQSESVCTFPSTPYGASAASMPLDVLSDPRSSPWSVQSEPSPTISMLELVMTRPTLDTRPIADFWELYKAYPKYLKNLEKRKKRKNKKKP
jgi:hypothetical protein